jgi:hypothetical protein
MAEQLSNGQSDKQELPAVRTTIVGGRPPGCGKMLGEIPRGIEVLVKKAAVDPAFRRLLLARRAEAAEEIGLVLQPAEVALLDAVPDQQLRAVIDRTRVAPEVRPAFLGKAAAVMLVALGVTGLETRAQVEVVDGIRAVQKAPASAPAPTAGVRVAKMPATAPAPGPVLQPAPPIAVLGLRAAGVRPAGPEPTSQPTSRPASQPAVPTISAAEFDRLIKQLDASGYKQRDEAQAKLQAQMPGITAKLEQALKAENLSPEQKNRMEAILEKSKPVRPNEIRAMRGLRMQVQAGVMVAPLPARVEPATKPKEDSGPKK